MFRLRQAIGTVAILAAVTAVATGCSKNRSIFGPADRVVTGTVRFEDGSEAGLATITSDTGAHAVADGAGRFSIRTPRGADVLIRAKEHMVPGTVYAATRSGSVLVKSYDPPLGHSIVLDQLTPI